MNSQQLLSTVIQFADKTLEEYKTSHDFSDTRSMVLVSLFRKIVELSDGVWVCADHGLKSPADLNIRALIEAYLAFKYINEDSNLSTDRAIAYKIGYHKQQIEACDDSLQNPLFNDNKDFYKQAIRKHKAELERKEYANVLENYNRLQKKDSRGFIPKWYSLNGGPKNVNRLAMHFNKNNEQPDLVSKLYSYLSTDAHNFMALRELSTMFKNETPILSSVRQSSDKVDLTLTRSLLLESTVSFLKVLYPDYLAEEEWHTFFNSIREHIEPK
ncbi:DUF5677 domain-containing protein [Bacillus spizizenii]|nr:DUF5677 domain-containing protein [Bacillus spizizenii]